MQKQRFCGNIVHSVLEDTVSHEEPLQHETMLQKYEEHKASYDPDKKISADLISIGKEIINEFYDQYSSTTFDVYEKEYGFSFIIGTYNVMGFIDRIDIVRRYCQYH